MARHVPPKPAYVQASAEPYWEMFTRTYDFEDVEAFTLAALCNKYAYAEKCEGMCFSSDGKPLPYIRKMAITQLPEDKDVVIANPFLDESSRAHREIERLEAALGIQVSAKVPVKPSVESPVDRAARKKAEKESR